MYAFSLTSATWNDAESRCKELSPGSHLVTIGNEEENDFVASKVKDNAEFWIGLRCELMRGKYSDSER